MSIGAEVAAHLPFLRRYARALTGSQSTGDAFVKATLEAALADRDLADSLKGGRVPLYAAFNKLWSSAYLDVGADDSDVGGLHETAAQDQLKRITPLNRQALLLTTVEDFTETEAAQIMDVDEDGIGKLVQEAIEEIDRENSTSVLIIEDEPLISMQLEDLVRSLGHEICGTAATRRQAQNAVAEKMPGLVLADIQLADGSSGLDAVDDILSMVSVAVIFVTAYPERLVTGDRPEPSCVFTKPVQESTVRAAMSLAGGVGASGPIS
jgi:DNA-directed RNA polymerase specialized sigma24 family protein/CheY-like chemotaxis protein